MSCRVTSEFREWEDGAPVDPPWHAKANPVSMSNGFHVAVSCIGNGLGYSIVPVSCILRHYLQCLSCQKAVSGGGVKIFPLYHPSPYLPAMIDS